MTFKTFLLGMLCSFGLAWMCMIAIPVAKMGALPPVKMSSEEDATYYQYNTSGRILNGAEIYASNGCYTCHSQLIRPTYLGSEIFRNDVAGIAKSEDGDTRRETHYDDYAGEKYAQIGLMRMGPDLSNFGYRAATYGAKIGMSAEKWIVAHLHNPRNSALQRGEQGEKIDMTWSNCPAQLQMFEKKDLNGQGDSLALDVDTKAMTQVVPGEDARVLASYLISLKRDSAVSESMDNSPKATENGAASAK